MLQMEVKLLCEREYATLTSNVERAAVFPVWSNQAITSLSFSRSQISEKNKLCFLSGSAEFLITHSSWNIYIIHSVQPYPPATFSERKEKLWDRSRIFMQIYSITFIVNWIVKSSHEFRINLLFVAVSLSHTVENFPNWNSWGNFHSIKNVKEKLCRAGHETRRRHTSSIFGWQLSAFLLAYCTAPN